MTEPPTDALELPASSRTSTAAIQILRNHFLPKGLYQEGHRLQDSILD
jgi:hypothetical protein